MKQMSPEDAAELVRSGDTIIISGNGETLTPDCLLEGIERRFVKMGQPANLTLIYNVIPGSQRHGTGVDRLAHSGLLSRIYAGTYYTLQVERLNDLLSANLVEAWLVPYGALYNMVRCAAGGQPGVLTPVGVGTFVDPRQGGSKLTDRTTTDVAEVVTIDEQEFLFYRAPRIDVAIIRASTGDENGNLSTEREPSTLGILHQAMAAKASGGTVIAQVEQVVHSGSIHPKRVTVPGIFVDVVTVVPEQMAPSPYEPAMTGDVRLPQAHLPNVPLDHRKVIARRVATELRRSEIVNCGFGLSASVPKVAAEEGVAGDVVFNVEHGPLGGVPNDKHSFGTGVNMEAIMDAPNIFEFYDAGVLDLALLGMGEVGPDGSVNVSHLNGRVNLGGFLDIVHATRRIIFCGTLTAAGLETGVGGGTIAIRKEGRLRRFVNHLQAVTFSGPDALDKGREVMYVTERAVFSLTEGGLVLTEVAPGIDLDRDIINRLDFPCKIREPLAEMDRRIFTSERMGLRDGGPVTSGPKRGS